MCTERCIISVIAFPSHAARVLAWDTLTRKQTIWTLNNYRQAALLDVTSCIFINAIDRPENDDNDVTAEINDWNVGNTYQNFVAVEVYVDGTIDYMIKAHVLPGGGNTVNYPLDGEYKTANFTVECT